jgi:hypothetical protein
VAVPALHRLEVGAAVVDTPFAGPHTPLMAVRPTAVAGSEKSDMAAVMYTQRKRFGFISFTTRD